MKSFLKGLSKSCIFTLCFIQKDSNSFRLTKQIQILANIDVVEVVFSFNKLIVCWQLVELFFERVYFVIDGIDIFNITLT